MSPDNQPAPLSGERLLVTGGAGFIGRTVVAALAGAGAEVTVADQNPSGLPGIREITGDLRDPQVRDAAVAPGLTGVIHLAAVTSVLGSLRDPVAVHEVNVEATAALLELCRLRGIGRFVMASTNAVTGDVGAERIHEGLPLRPLTPYGATKAAAEMLLSGYAGGYGMTTCALRLTNVYGPGMAGGPVLAGRPGLVGGSRLPGKDSVVPRLMRAVRNGTAIEVYGTGEQRRDFVHVEDVVAGLLVAWRTGHTGPLIIGSGESVTVLELIEAVEKATGCPVPVRHVPAKPGEMPAVLVSIERAAALGYRPQVALATGLAGVWDEFRPAP